MKSKIYNERNTGRLRRLSVWLMTIILAAIAAFGVPVLCGCEGSGYTRISQDEAVKMMNDQPGCVIVDVRRPDEFAEGHIPGAVNVPNEGIALDMTDQQAEELYAQLPDKEQVILVYCRTGNRSKEASAKLAKLGYTNVYEFGGIETWEGGTVTD
jgi:rhodanese-related sulfurtransferase